jgi:PAS domain-containing protein
MTPLDSSELPLQIHDRLIHELGASEKRYRELVEHLREIIFECDNTGRLTFLNQVASSIARPARAARPASLSCAAGQPK